MSRTWRNRGRSQATPKLVGAVLVAGVLSGACLGILGLTRAVLWLPLVVLTTPAVLQALGQGLRLAREYLRLSTEQVAEVRHGRVQRTVLPSVMCAAAAALAVIAGRLTVEWESSMCVLFAMFLLAGALAYIAWQGLGLKSLGGCGCAFAAAWTMGLAGNLAAGIGAESVKPLLLAVQCDRAQLDVQEGDLNVKRGNLDQAELCYSRAQGSFRTIAGFRPGDADAERNLAVSLRKMGDVKMAHGNLPGARKDYEDAEKVAECSAHKHPGDAQTMREHALCEAKIAVVLTAQGDFDGGRKQLNASHAILERLAAQEPGDVARQRDLFASFDSACDMLLEQGDPSGAAEAFTSGQAIRARLPVFASYDDQLHDEMRTSMRKGYLEMMSGDRQAALEADKVSLGCAKRLCARDPTNTTWQRSLVFCHIRVGYSLRAVGDLPGAVAAYRDGLIIAESLAAKDRTNATWQVDWATCTAGVGSGLMASNNKSEGYLYVKRGSDVFLPIAQTDPTNVKWKKQAEWFRAYEQKPRETSRETEHATPVRS